MKLVKRLEKEMKVLHNFKKYLPVTENWSYRLINGVRKAQHHIATKEYMKSNFYAPHFTYWEYPVSMFSNPERAFKKSLANWLIRKIYSKVYSHEAYFSDKAREAGIELVHSHFANIGWEYGGIAKKLNVPHIISFYGYDYESKPFLEPEWNGRYQQLFKTTDAFICEGAHGKKILERLGCDPDKVHVVHLGVDVKAIPFIKRQKEANCLNLLQIATFREKKGHIYTVKAFEKALQNCPDMTLTLVGGGPGPVKREVEQYVKEARLSSKVVFKEQIDYTRLHEFMAAYDVFIHPSCYSATRDCEGGAPIVLLDCQASGMPVISTFHCDIPGEVKDGYTGLLAEEKDVETMAQHIERFYHMPQEEYNQFGVNARQHVEEHFESEKCSLQLQAVYESILKSRKGE